MADVAWTAAAASRLGRSMRRIQPSLTQRLFRRISSGHQHASRRDHIGDSVGARRASAGQDRPQENRMQVHGVEACRRYREARPMGGDQ